MDNEKKIADLKADQNSAQNPAQIADLKADLTPDTIADTNAELIPDSNTAETMAAGIPERETILAPTQSSSLVFETDACTSELSVAENQPYSSEAVQSTGIPTTRPEETSQASSEYTPRHSSGMMVPVMELENSTANTKEQQVVPEVSQAETSEPTIDSTVNSTLDPDKNTAYTSEPEPQNVNPYSYDGVTQYSSQSETGYPERNETQVPVNNETSVHNETPVNNETPIHSETPVNNLVYGPMAPKSNPYQDDDGYNMDYNITSDDWSNMKQQEAKEYMEYDRYKREKEEDSKPRLHFENMAAEDDDDDDRPRKSGIKKSVIAALAIITITGLGSLFFYTFEAAQRKNEELKNFTMQVNEDLKYEYGKDVVLKAETFVKNMDEMPEEIKKTIKLDSELMTDSTQYSYNKSTNKVVTKDEKYLNEGTYDINISYEQNGGKKYEHTRIEVKDTVAPRFTKFQTFAYVCQNATGVNPTNFVRATDLNKVTYSYKPSEYNLKKPGRYTVNVTAEDRAGNKTTKKMTFKVISEEDVGTGKIKLTKDKYGNTKWSQGAKDIKNGKSPKDTAAEEAEKKKKLEEERKKAEADAEAQAKKELEEQEKKNKTGWEGNKYYLSGQMLTGSQYVDGKWYYFDYGNGDKVSNQWIMLNGARQYYGADGSRAEGFTEVSEGGTVNTYYFGTTGTAQIGWLAYNGNQYYFDNNGHQVFGDYEIDGKIYHFDATTGAWDGQNPNEN